MQFHLGFQPNISQQKITHQDGLLMMGSCFSEHIGKKLSDLKFNVSTNPLGIVFNPESIITTLNRIIDKNYFTEQDVFENDKKWFCLDTHSSFSGNSSGNLTEALNSILVEWYLKLKQADYLNITFGSAYVYIDKSKNKVVANCHKLPQTYFQKELLETPVIVDAFNRLFNKLKEFNPDLKVILTVSPVKHLRDGVVENTLSKAVLIQSVHQLVHQNKNCFYFPAFELVNDDLRDYRFYEGDMAHPNALAIDYVWEKFSQTYFDKTTLALNEKLGSIRQAVNHKLFDEESEASVKFKTAFYQKCMALQSEFSFLNLKKELNYFQPK
jgi:hypothetical protein